MTGAVVAPRSASNWELLAERERRDWTYFVRLRRQREKELRDPQDVLEGGLAG